MRRSRMSQVARGLVGLALLSAACNGPSKPTTASNGLALTAAQPAFDLFLLLQNFDAEGLPVSWAVDGAPVKVTTDPVTALPMLDAQAPPHKTKVLEVKTPGGVWLADPFTWGPQCSNQFQHLTAERQFLAVRTQVKKVYLNRRDCEYDDGRVYSLFLNH